MRALVMSAQVNVVLRSAVVDRRKPVIPMREPKRDERNKVPMYGAQWALWAPMVSLTKLYRVETAFSVRT